MEDTTHIMEYLTDMDDIEFQVRQERCRQHKKFGEQNHTDGTGGWNSREAATIHRDFCNEAMRCGDVTWKDILTEEVYEAFAEKEPEKLKTELIQVMAVCKAWIECIERRKEQKTNE